MKIQIKINGEELLPVSSIDRVVWGAEQAEALDRLVEESGLTLRVIAQKSGVSHSYIDKLRRNTGATDLEVLTKVLAALDQTLYAVFKPPAIEISFDNLVTE